MGIFTLLNNPSGSFFSRRSLALQKKNTILIQAEIKTTNNQNLPKKYKGICPTIGGRMAATSPPP